MGVTKPRFSFSVLDISAIAKYLLNPLNIIQNWQLWPVNYQHALWEAKGVPVMFKKGDKGLSYC